jgi:hypothetical protein
MKTMPTQGLTSLVTTAIASSFIFTPAIALGQNFNQDFNSAYTLAQTPITIDYSSDADFDTAVFQELNRVRTNPELYLKYLKENLKYFNSELNALSVPNQIPVPLTQGKLSIDRTITRLEAQTKLSAANPFTPITIAGSNASNPYRNEINIAEFQGNFSKQQIAQYVTLNILINNPQSYLLSNGLNLMNVKCAELKNCVVEYRGKDLDNTPVATYEPEDYLLYVENSLAAGDPVMPAANDNSYYDFYQISAKKDQELTIALFSETFDTFLVLLDKNNEIILQNDDINQDNRNSLIDVVIPEDDDYWIIVNSYEAQVGPYTLAVCDNNATGSPACDQLVIMDGHSPGNLANSNP